MGPAKNVNGRCECGKVVCSCKCSGCLPQGFDIFQDNYHVMCKGAYKNAFVRDDANRLIYLYDRCGTPTMLEWGVSNKMYKFEREMFVGEFPENTITLAYEPAVPEEVFVFKNGLNQTFGVEYDVIWLTTGQIRFNWYNLEAKDKVEVAYKRLMV